MINTGTYLLRCMYVYRHMRKNSSIRKPYLKTNIFQKWFNLVGLREQLFQTIVSYALKTLQNDKIFGKLWIYYLIFQEKIIPRNLFKGWGVVKERGVKMTPCHPPLAKGLHLRPSISCEIWFFFKFSSVCTFSWVHCTVNETVM